MQENKQSVLTGLLILIIAGVVFYLLQVFGPKTETTPEVDYSPLVETSAIELLSGPLQVVGEGLVRPRRRVSLAPQVSGEIIFKSPDLKLGGRFSKGDVLVKVDPRNFESEATRIRGMIMAAESQLTYAKSQVKRLSDLKAKNAESESRLENQIAQQGDLQGQLIALRAQFQRAQLDVERSSLRAPFNGAVFTEELDVGNIVQAGQMLAQIYAEDVFEIIVALDDDEASLIPGLWSLEVIGKKIQATVAAEFGNELYTWDAQVDAVETGLDQSARTINVIVLVEEPQLAGYNSKSDIQSRSSPPLLPGMYASVSIAGLTPKSSAIVPADAIHGDKQIWLLDTEQKLRIELVDILQTYENSVVIQSSILQTGLHVITSKLPVAVNGMNLRRYQSGQDND
jgi:RND family efflux transporter MFP subunit